MKIAYTVSCRIADPRKADKWLAWLRNGHLGDVLGSGAESAEIVRMDIEGPESVFEIRYRFPSREAYDAYIQNYAPHLREKGLKLFPPEDGFTYSRSAGEIL